MKGKPLSFVFKDIEFENPFLIAATPSSDDIEMVVEGLRAGWSGVILKTTTVDKTAVDLKYPMMAGIRYNNQMITLGNIDLISEHSISKIEKTVKTLKDKFPSKIIIPSVMGRTKEEWQTLTKQLIKAGADMIEYSFSCPQGNIGEDPGKMLSQSAKATKTVVEWLRSASKNTPILIKLTPQITDITDIAKAVLEGGGDAVVISNSVIGLTGIDIETQRPIPTVNGYGSFAGITGPSIKPIILKNVVNIMKNVKIPVFGVGGISDHRDAIEYFLAGACPVQVGTGIMKNGYRIINGLVDGTLNYLRSKKANSIKDILGKALPYIVEYDKMPYKNEDAPAASIDKNKCIGCKKCFIACDNGGHRAIFIDDDDDTAVDEEKCFGCGFCPTVCPVNAIKLVKRKKRKDAKK